MGLASVGLISSCKDEVVSAKRYLTMHNDLVESRGWTRREHAWAERDRAFMSVGIKGRDIELTEVMDTQRGDINVVNSPI